MLEVLYSPLVYHVFKHICKLLFLLIKISLTIHKRNRLSRSYWNTRNKRIIVKVWNLIGITVYRIILHMILFLRMHYSILLSLFRIHILLAILWFIIGVLFLFIFMTIGKTLLCNAFWLIFLVNKWFKSRTYFLRFGFHLIILRLVLYRSRFFDIRYLIKFEATIFVRIHIRRKGLKRQWTILFLTPDKAWLHLFPALFFLVNSQAHLIFRFASCLLNIHWSTLHRLSLL